MNKELTKSEIIKAFKDWYMPNYFDITMFDYTKISDDEIYDIYLLECENYTKQEIDSILLSHMQ